LVVKKKQIDVFSSHAAITNLSKPREGVEEVYIISNAPPSINKQTHRLDVYGGLAVAVIDSIPPGGAVWAGITTDPNDTKPSYDATHDVERLPILVQDKTKYLAHYAPWCKGKVYTSFHGLLDYAGISSDRFAQDPAVTEAHYEAHMHTINDFAEKLAAQIRTRDGDQKKPIIVHDYQIIELAAALRKNGLEDRTIGHFLHIPFPEPDVFWQIPHSQEILTSYLSYDLIAFQDKERSIKNFVETVRQLYPNTEYDAATGKMTVNGRERLVKHFPASIDPDSTLNDAKGAENRADVSAILEEAAGRKIIFSAQRFDIIKGMPQALTAVEQMLDENPAIAQNAFFVFCCQTTKYDGMRCYDEYQQESLDTIGKIQSKHPGAFKLLNGLPRESVLGVMRHSDVMYIPTLIEGQNLVIKEYIAANEGHDKRRVAILSTGCAAYFGLKDTNGIFIHNPSDVEEHKLRLKEALSLADPEARNVLRAQQEAIRDWTSIHYGHGLTAALQKAAETPHLNGFAFPLEKLGQARRGDSLHRSFSNAHAAVPQPEIVSQKSAYSEPLARYNKA
jgi:trehalose-6-phosphate synthase